MANIIYRVDGHSFDDLDAAHEYVAATFFRPGDEVGREREPCRDGFAFRFFNESGEDDFSVLVYEVRL
jgi:hypothetical protein